jgi:hypothetical protein
MSLDPKTNRQQREVEKAKKAAEEPPLNPLFPHKRQAFDPFFFSLERETPDEEAARKAAR